MLGRSAAGAKRLMERGFDAALGLRRQIAGAAQRSECRVCAVPEPGIAAQRPRERGNELMVPRMDGPTEERDRVAALMNGASVHDAW